MTVLVQINKSQLEIKMNTHTCMHCEAVFTCLKIAHGVNAVHCATHCVEMSTADVRERRARSHNWIFT